MKKNIVKTNLIGLFVSLLSIIMFSCNQEDGVGRIVVRLTDAPGDYEEVNVDIQDVQVNASNEEGEGGWKSLPNVNKGVYNLLDLTNGTETVLTSAEYPTGKISQIRLVLGSNNTVKIDGNTYALQTPSAQQSGLKLNLHADLTEGITYSILLDFDAAQSVVSTGSGKYLLKPVITVVSEALDGAVKGKVDPAGLNVAVFALSGEDTVKSSYVMNGGADYFLGGLAAGTYSIAFDPGDNSEYDSLIVENVNVAVGSITELDVVLQKKAE